MNEGIAWLSVPSGLDPADINSSPRKKGTKESAFYDESQADNLSYVMKYFLGGLNRYLPELFLLLAPHVNSYKRYQYGLFTPLNNTWGINNKTVAFMALNVSPGATRIEVRNAGADMCPHLALLAVLAAGRMGIEQEIAPPAPVETMAMRLKSLKVQRFRLTSENQFNALMAPKLLAK